MAFNGNGTRERKRWAHCRKTSGMTLSIFAIEWPSAWRTARTKVHVADVLGLDTVTNFNLYCHYVAGLVGEGPIQLSAASGKEAAWLDDRLALANAMELSFQKANILRDSREDVEDGRLFRPRENWGEYGFDDYQRTRDEHFMP